MISLAALSLASLAAPAAAQPAPAAAIKAGTIVKDTAGGEVGTVASVEGQYVTVKTDRNEVRLPATSFTPVEGALLFGMTRDQLNAEVDKAKAAADAKIVAGAAVTGAAGASVGTIEAVDAEAVTLKLPSGALVKLPRAAVAGGPSGLITSATLADLEAAAKSAQPQP
jgi:preprotein translocase subunit YajC